MIDVRKLHKKLIKVFNAFIRERDKDKRCISCGVGTVAHAGHYFPTSLCPEPAMRFNEKNVNGQCVHCNTFLEGNRQGYERGLRQRYGDGVILELDVKRTLKHPKWTAWEYMVVIQEYENKLKELKGDKNCH